MGEVGDNSGDVETNVTISMLGVFLRMKLAITDRESSEI
jgi:hypothetical protein